MLNLDNYHIKLSIDDDLAVDQELIDEILVAMPSPEELVRYFLKGIYTLDPELTGVKLHIDAENDGATARTVTFDLGTGDVTGFPPHPAQMPLITETV